MPCRVDDGAFDSGVGGVSRDKYNKLKEETDLVTRLLCGLMSAEVESDNEDWAFDHVKGLREWWKEHQKLDYKRLQNDVMEAVKTIHIDQLRQIEKIISKGKE